MSGTYLDPIIIYDEDLNLHSQDLIPRGGATVTNPDTGPTQDLSRNLPALVLYWQPIHLPAYLSMHLNLVMTLQDLMLLTLFLWILF